MREARVYVNLQYKVVSGHGKTLFASEIEIVPPYSTIIYDECESVKGTLEEGIIQPQSAAILNEMVQYSLHIQNKTGMMDLWKKHHNATISWVYDIDTYTVQ